MSSFPICWAAPLTLPLSAPRGAFSSVRRRPPFFLTRCCVPASRPIADFTGSRPDGEAIDPAFIPQTIEYALRCAQSATAAAFAAEETRVSVTLPMGRSRRHWYRLSPLDGVLVRKENVTLALHFVSMFKGLRIRVVLGMDPDVGWNVPWIERCDVVGEEGKGWGQGVPEEEGSEPDVVLLGGFVASQKIIFEEELSKIGRDSAVVVFNCFTEVALGKLAIRGLDGFKPAYVCRSDNKTALLFVGYGEEADGWNIYTETAIFEFEWVGRRSAELWTPTAKTVDVVVQGRGCKRKAMGGYWESAFAACESGFWPFMTIASPQILPIPGCRFASKVKSSKGSPKPFGFF